MLNQKGESTNALYGLIRSFFKIVKDFSPQHFVAVFDGPGNKDQRTSLYSEYKSHRTGMPGDLFLQLERALEFCKIAGIPHLSLPNVEADDVIGAIALWAEKKGADVFICSSDKDLCQLVSDHIFLINPSKDNLLIDKKKVKELFGVYPEQMVDFLALTGDASDNIPGVEGFGPKTAANVLNEFKTLENILAHPEKVGGQKKQEALIRDKEKALLSKQLVTLLPDVAFPQDNTFFQFKEPDLEKVKDFYQEMHFLSLLKELGEPKTTAPVIEEDEKTHYLLVDDEASLKNLIQELSAAKEICLDTETTDVRPMYARLVGIGLGVKAKKAWYIPVNGKLGREKVVKMLKPLLENPTIGFFGHNLKYDLHVLLNEGLHLSNICFDTILASYLLHPQNQRHNLDSLSLEKFGKIKIPIEDLIGKGKNQISMQDVEIEKVCTYCCEDVDYTCRLKALFAKELEKENLLYVFEQIELPLMPVLMQMEHTGIFVDTKKLEEMSSLLSHELDILQKEIYTFSGEEFNINSPKQLSQILFEKLKIKPLKKTMTGFSTSADVLESLQGSSPIVKKILQYRLLQKLKSTYVDSLPGQVFPKTHRVHCTFNQSVTATGRLSCQDPNLQNIPIRSKEGRKIREAFRPQNQGFYFLGGDYSQVELRLLAHLSEDPALLKAFNEGEDIHIFTASLVYDIPLKEVSEEMRQQAKAVNYGILYGQQAFGLSQGLDISYAEAATFIETYFKRYSQVKEYLESCKEAARKTGFAITITGRKRPIPEILSKNPAIRAFAERLAINTPLQGTAADLIKIAMIQLSESLKKDPSLGTMILQIHDELLFEVSEHQAPNLSKLVKSTMENVFDLKVPLVVDISIGKNWGEC